jgi:hypothetical protein
MHGSSTCCDIQSWPARGNTMLPRMAGLARGSSARAQNAGSDETVVAIAVSAVVLNQPRLVSLALFMPDSLVSFT